MYKKPEIKGKLVTNNWNLNTRKNKHTTYVNTKQNYRNKSSITNENTSDIKCATTSNTVHARMHDPPMHYIVTSHLHLRSTSSQIFGIRLETSSWTSWLIYTSPTGWTLVRKVHIRKLLKQWLVCLLIRP